MIACAAQRAEFALIVSIFLLFGALRSLADDNTPPPDAAAPGPSVSAPAPSGTSDGRSRERTAILNQILPSECQLGYVNQPVAAKSPEEQFATLRAKRKVIINCVRQAEGASQEMSTNVIALSNQLSDLKRELDDYRFGPESVPSEEELKRWIRNDELDKADLQGEITAAKSAPTGDETKIQQLESDLNTLLDRQKADQDKLDNYKEIKQAFDEGISSRENNINSLQADIDHNKSEQKVVSNALYMMGRDLDETDNQISQLTATTTDNNDYKTKITLAFTLLVGFVIVGFFWLANKSTDISRQIFANDSGIQFITLFSLVIAIILFGVIGVLEGKELAALLAGLSGYILGRANNTTRPKPPEPEPEPTAQPQPTR